MAEMTGQSAGSYYDDGFQPTAPGETDDGQSTASYSSQEGITAKADVERLTFGLTADTVVVRNLTDELRVAFKDPDANNDAWITVESADSPFVLAGVYGIDASQMWHEQGPTAGGDHDFDVLAVERRGR